MAFFSFMQHILLLTGTVVLMRNKLEQLERKTRALHNSFPWAVKFPKYVEPRWQIPHRL